MSVYHTIYADRKTKNDHVSSKDQSETVFFFFTIVKNKQT